ncbi:protein phosphatase 1 regulatory subunit 37 [Neosynchiropus ocellatus]
MNIEEQRLDLCNIKSINNVDDELTTSNNTEVVITSISDLVTDSHSDKLNIVATEASDCYLMPQLTDNIQAVEEDNHQPRETLEIDEVNGNKRTSAEDTPESPPGLVNDDQHMDNIVVDKMKEAKDVEFATDEMEDNGDMDIGVDLSLDETGVLEGDSTNSKSLPDSNLTSQVVPGDVLSVPSQAGGAGSTEQAALYPVVEEVDNTHKPSGKRVTFPSDEDIVSGAVEPKDPWRHALNVTVDDILSSYKQACQKLNCKPIPKVLKQIQELRDLTQRNECFDLKGEKLDYKSCESLEEILKRVQFKVIDLEQTNLDEDGASALFDMIEYYESATHLNISFNKHIGTRGWQAAAHMMRKTSSLQYLDARNTPLLDHSAPFVARALRISGSLAVLHLENAGLSGRPLMLLATALKMNMNLRELYLADNKLNGLQDSAQLGNLLKFNYNIQILDLRNNHILDSGLAYVCEGLKEQRKGLVTLVLWNNQLTHNGMGYLAAALPCTQSLETLNLGHNSVGNEGVHKLKDGLIANRSVLRLGLASTKLSCEGAVAVAEFIAESPRLLRLDLRENEIKTGGLMALSLALKVNTSLLRLDLDREPKKETVKSFIETQRALLAEIQNGCKRNFILAKEKEETEQKMRQSASMAEIATEDGTREEEEETGKNEEKTEAGEGQEAEKKPETGSQLGAGTEAGGPQVTEDSDSDTEDEEEVQVVTKPPPRSNAQTEKTSETPCGEKQTPVAASSPSPTAAGPNIISGITVTEAPVPPGTPPSPGRCISVSSPGRGHKIFMVTRVESPPEQQVPAASSHKEDLKKSLAMKSEASGAAGPQPAQQEATPAALSTTPESTAPPTQEAEVSTLDSPETDPSPQEPAMPSLASVEPTSEKAPESSESGAQISIDQEDEDTPETSTEEGPTRPGTHKQQQTPPSEDSLSQTTKDAALSEQESPTETIQPAPAGENLTEPGLQETSCEASEDDVATSSSGSEAADSTSSSPPEESPEESSAEEGEENTEESDVVGPALPNGLKSEFSLHLLETETPKPGSCVMEHVSVSCSQDLEELLLEASLDTGRDAP